MRWPPPDDWPHRDISRRIYARPHRWHVQETGKGGTLLLIHGAGGSTHSYRDMIPLLSASYHVVALDLPGQGFTQLGARHRSGIEATAEDLATLCAQEGWEPVGIVGHSAGGALALRLSQQVLSPRGHLPKVVGINPALDNFDGLAGVLFPVLAKVLAAVPFTAQMFSATAASPGRVEALIKGTGSDIGPEGISYYRRLFSDRDHVDATLTMMAQWSLDPLLEDLPRIEAQTLFLTGSKDQTVPPSVSVRAAERMPNAQVKNYARLGHLAHEERPRGFSRLILKFLAS